MSRKITMEQGRKDIEWIMDRYPRDLHTKRVHALIRITLHAVVACEGAVMANALICQYGLYHPGSGSHNWFKDGQKHTRVIHLDPNFKIPDEWRIFPGDKNHPGMIRFNLKGEHYNV